MSDEGLEINHEGTLVYNDLGHLPLDQFAGIRISSYDADTALSRGAMKAGAEVTHESAPYACSWYDGVDSYMASTTLEEFLLASGQTVDEI